MLKGASYKGFMFKKVWGKKYISRLNKKKSPVLYFLSQL